MVYMNKRTLGKTCLSISEVGFGCGGYWGLKIFDEKTAIRLVHRSIDHGINFFDTGNSYSGGNAEARLGKALSSVNNDNLIVGTKVGTVIKGRKLVKDFSKASIKNQVEDSLRKLNVDSLSIVQLHVNDVKHLTSEALETLDLLKFEGKLKYIGVSCDGQVLDKALGIDAIDVVMLTYNILEQKPFRQIMNAYDTGKGILIKSPLAHGLYSNDIFKLKTISDVWYFARVLKNYRAQLLRGIKYRFINRIPDWSPHHIALLFALHKKVSSVVIGTTSIHHLDENIEALTRKIPLDIRRKIESF